MLKKLPQLSIAKNLLKKQVPQVSNNDFESQDKEKSLDSDTFENNSLDKDDSFYNTSSYNQNNDIKDNISLYKSNYNEYLIKNIISVNVLVCVIFIILYFVSSLLVFRNNYLYNNLQQNLITLNELSDTENEYLSIVKSIEDYKKLQQGSSKISEKLYSIKGVIPDNIEIINLLINNNQFEISVSSKQLINFSVLLNSYLENDKISYLYLQDVSLDYDTSDEATFTVKLNGEFE